MTAVTAGVLSVAVDGTGDLMITIVDTDGQVVPDGSADRDLHGSLGRELLSVTITEPGDCAVRIDVLSGGSSAFEIAGSFLSLPALAVPPDPDGLSAGERLYVRVAGAFGSVQGSYRISSSVVRGPR